MTSVLVIGCGNMGSSLLRGILNSSLPNVKLSAYDVHHEKLDVFKPYENIELLNAPPKGKTYDVVFLCVKPSDLETCAKWSSKLVTKDTVVVSILAGIEIEKISELYEHKCGVVRAMPNICATVHEAATALSANESVSLEKIKVVKDLFNTIGTSIEIREGLLDAVTGLSGSGPAYIFMIIEALIDGGVKMGIPRDISADLVIQTVKGSCEVVKQSGVHPAVLKDQVTTPGGTTIHAVHELESHGLRSILINAVVTATEQSKKLAKK